MANSSIQFCLSIDPGTKNLGIVMFSFSRTDTEVNTLVRLIINDTIDIIGPNKSRKMVNVCGKKKGETINDKLYNSIQSTFERIGINPADMNYIIIEGQMASNPSQIRVQALLYSFFRTRISEQNADTMVVEVSSHNKLNWFTAEDIEGYGYKVRPPNPKKKRQKLSSRITSRAKKNLAIKYCKRHYGLDMTEHEADALLQALVLLDIRPN